MTIPLTIVELDDCDLTAFGYDPASTILAATFKSDPDTYHFGPGVPQEVVDGLAQSVAYYSDPTGDMFGGSKPQSPDHYMTAFVSGTSAAPIYGFTKVAGAAVADDVAEEDPTLPLA